MKLAITYDRINKYGGAERILSALHQIWPDAPFHTAFYSAAGAPWAERYNVQPSVLQRIPGANRNHEFFSWATPFAFELMDFDRYDVVLSVTSAEAKNIITKPGTCHICYCLTPTRYLWSGSDDYINYPGLGTWGRLSAAVLKLCQKHLRRWDYIAGARPDYYIAISEIVKKRIEKYYNRQVSAVVYPPVDTDKFRILPDTELDPAIMKKISKYPPGYFLAVSRFVGYKRLDLLISVFNKNGLPLVVIGTGREAGNLKKTAGSNIYFVTDHLTDEEMVYYYNFCRAYIHAAQEDFGLAAAETLACGKPVISYRNSGIAEIAKDGETGIFFDRQTEDSLHKAIKQFNIRTYSRSECRKNSLRFSVKEFKAQIAGIVEQKSVFYKENL